MIARLMGKTIMAHQPDRKLLTEPVHAVATEKNVGIVEVVFSNGKRLYLQSNEAKAIIRALICSLAVEIPWKPGERERLIAVLKDY
jgi:hypothetical protein